MQGQCRQRLQQRGRRYEHREMNRNKRAFRGQQNVEHKRHKYWNNRRYEPWPNKNKRTLEHEIYEVSCPQKNKSLSIVRFPQKKTVKALIDTGSGVNAMSVDFWNKIGAPKLEPVDINFAAVNRKNV